MLIDSVAHSVDQVLRNARQLQEFLTFLIFCFDPNLAA